MLVYSCFVHQPRLQPQRVIVQDAVSSPLHEQQPFLRYKKPPLLDEALAMWPQDQT